MSSFETLLVFAPLLALVGVMVVAFGAFAFLCRDLEIGREMRGRE